MKLIIDISERIYKASQILDVKHEDTIQIPLEVIANGTPYETVTEFADRCRECGAKYGKLLKQEPVLDKIRAEIEQEIIPRNSDQYDHEAMWQNAGLRMALKVIGKYKAESEEK